jgi:hypothetical protein
VAVAIQRSAFWIAASAFGLLAMTVARFFINLLAVCLLG